MPAEDTAFLLVFTPGAHFQDSAECVRAVGLNCLLFLDASCSAGPAALSHVPASPVYPAQTCPDTPFLAALLSFLPELSCVLGLVAGTCSELHAVPDGCPLSGRFPKPSSLAYLGPLAANTLWLTFNSRNWKV